MKLRLYDNKSIKLEKYDCFQDRLTLLNESFFSNKKYQKYYCKRTFKNNDRRYVNYWLGVKPVGQKRKSESVKITLDFIGGYLFYSRDFDTKTIKRKYLDLLRKYDDHIISTGELKELKNLSNNIIYKRPSNSYKMGKNLIFFVNNKYENFIKSRSNQTYAILMRIKSQVKQLDSLFSKLKIERKNLIDKMSHYYKSDSEYISNEEISNTAYKIKHINRDMKYIRNAIEQLFYDYYFITEQKSYL